jgi:hypothetical protein
MRNKEPVIRWFCVLIMGVSSVVYDPVLPEPITKIKAINATSKGAFLNGC